MQQFFFPSTSISCTCRISSVSLNEHDWCCRSLPACRVASRSDYFQRGCSKIINFHPLPMSAISHGNPCYGGVFEFLSINSWLSGLCEVLNILLVSVRRESFDSLSCIMYTGVLTDVSSCTLGGSTRSNSIPSMKSE